MSKTLVVLSGGMDSATLLYYYLEQGHAVEAISIDYRQRHRKELKYAHRLCSEAKVPFDVLDLTAIGQFLTGSSQSDPGVAVPFGRYDEPTMKLTVVPNRNMFLLAAAGAVAVARKCDVLAYGAHAGDHTIYPDCRPEFIEMMAGAFQLCDWHPLRLEAPFSLLSKGDICRLGLTLGVPFKLTWTCYVGEDQPCGKCGACIERAEAFLFAGATDPLCP